MDIYAINYKTQQPVKVEISQGLISGVYALNDSIYEGLPYIAPGLIDLQVNGYKGVDFNTLPLKGNHIKEMSSALWMQGVTTYFPTVITNSDEFIKKALQSIVIACKEYEEVAASIGGIHLEGPFISTEDGARGAHSRDFVKAPDWHLFESWQEAAEGKIKLITLSPEWKGSARFIEQCVNHSVKVAIGHTSANAEQISEAISAGATLSTHLGNACHHLLPRHENYIWEQLASENLWASIIADGFHLPDSLLKVFLKVKSGKIMLVSDSTSFAGLAPGVYSTHIGGVVELNEEGKLFIQGHPKTLAGSAQSILWGVNQLVQKQLLSLNDAWDLASIKPKEFLGADQQEFLQVGTSQDLVLFQKTTDGIQVFQTIKSGRPVFINL